MARRGLAGGGRGPGRARPPFHRPARREPGARRRAGCGQRQLGAPQIVDARAPERFRGEVPEPRPGLRPGRISGARNVHFKAVLNPDGTMKSPDALRAVFEAAGVDAGEPVITSCGSGVTAAILNLALERLGNRSHALYDGSWAEWGAYPDLKVERG